MENYTKRKIMQAFFLGLFLFLFANNFLKIWAAFWGIGIIISLLFDRIYCGSACPMGIFLRIQSWIYDKLGISRLKVKSKIVLNSLRAILIIIFLIGMIAVRVYGYQINIILMITTAAILVSFVFEENFWHRICPHGTVLSLSNKPAKFKMNIDPDKCTGCGLCEKACPNNTISTVEDTKIREIENKECLVCFECQHVCPVDAISYEAK